MTAVAEVAAPPAASEASAAEPYPGLRPFDEADAALFFGREREIATVLKLLEERQLVVVHGASGCGKSSVVRAGVVPIFRLDALANDADPRIIILRPADAGGPLRSLARKLEREFPRGAPECAIGAAAPEEAEGPTRRSWSEILSASPDYGREISDAVGAAGATLCLIVDQFEEIFAISRAGQSAEARRLIEFLIALGEPAPEGTALGERPLSVILTMRSDYLGHCALWDGFAETVNECQYLLPRVSTLGLLRSIHEPARLFDGHVTEAAADRLLPLMAREIDGLPILQHALMRSWRAVAGAATPTIGVDTIEAIGGVETALSRHAEEAFARATEGDRERIDVANWIFRALSDLDTDGRVIRRPVSLADLVVETGGDPTTIRAILDVFRAPEFSLIAPYAPEPLEDASIVSVSHEALLRQWERITDPRFDEKGRPTGLVNREFQDGMIARALSIQAETFAREGAGVLGAAATEQRLPWYEEIGRRPDWIIRYPLRRGPNPREQAREQWRHLAAFMDASRANLEVERDKLARERKMVRRLRRGRTYLLLMGSTLIATAGYAGWSFLERASTRLEAAQNDTRIARGLLTQTQLASAHYLAVKRCEGLNLVGTRCPESVEKQALAEIMQDNINKPIDAETQKTINLPFSNYGASYGGGIAEHKPEATK